jgi:Domain of unknown function (DUF4917)
MRNPVNWTSIANGFQDSLLLGNGASIAVDRRFAYKNLLHAARQLDLITSQLDQVFTYLQTEDFERVLEMLWHTHHINEALGIRTREARTAYRDIRKALVKVVRKHHCSYSDVEDVLGEAAYFMMKFQTIISLNYDLIVYWAMMKGNKDQGNWFKDGFVKDGYSFDRDWQRLKKPYNAKGSTLVFYPHGNLALASNLAGRDHKVVVGKASDLLGQVLDDWYRARSVPLFVAEGVSRQKEAAIRRSEYLATVYDEVLADLGDSLAIYGWSLGDYDTHILKKILEGKLQRIALSVRTNHRKSAAVREQCQELEKKIRSYSKKIDVTFFAAESDGCWCNGYHPAEDGRATRAPRR